MDTETLLTVIEKCDRHIGAINAMQDVDSLDAADYGRLWAYEEMRDTLVEYVKNISSELYQTLIQNAGEEVSVRLTWDELQAVLGAVKHVKNMVDSTKLDAAYVKLSTKYKGV
jgi:hypothetical protein